MGLLHGQNHPIMSTFQTITERTRKRFAASFRNAPAHGALIRHAPLEQTWPSKICMRVICSLRELLARERIAAVPNSHNGKRGTDELKGMFCV